MQQRVAQAAMIAAAQGFHVEISSSNKMLMDIRRGAAFASLHFAGTYLKIELLKIDITARRRGYGKALLTDIIAIADELGLQIELMAASMQQERQPGLSQRKLKSWYHRYGFTGNDIFLSRLPMKNPLSQPYQN